MKSAAIVVPALVASCHGAALPQVLVPSGISVVLSQPTDAAFTFVIPCAPGAAECSPRTMTLFGREAEEMPRSLLAREPQTLGPGVSRTDIILPPGPTTDCDSSTSSKSSKHHESSTTTSTTVTKDGWKRQVLGDPTRTNIILPPGPSTTSDCDSTTTKKHTSTKSTSSDCDSTTTKKHTSSKSTSSDCDSTTKHWKRQILGDPTRTNLLTPTPYTTDDASTEWPSATPVVITVTETVTSSSSSTDCDSSSLNSDWAPEPTDRSTSWGDGSTRTVPALTVPTIWHRDVEDATTTTVYVTATPSTSTRSKTKKPTTVPSSSWEHFTTTTTYVSATSTTSCDPDWEDCDYTTTSKPHWSPTPSPSTGNDLTATLTLPGLTLGWPPKRDVDEADKKTKKTTTIYPKQRTTLTPGSGRGTTIVNSATLPRITFTAPGKRDAAPEPIPWKTTSTSDCDFTTTKAPHHHTTTSSDYIIRTTVTLPGITLGRREADLEPVPWKTTSEDCDTTTSTTKKPHHHTSSTDSVIRATVTLPGITLGRREADPEPVPWKTTSEDCDTTTSTTKKPHPHPHKTSTSDSVIRATVTLPGITLGPRDITVTQTTVMTAEPTSTWTANLSGFQGWSWYWPFPQPTTTGGETVTLTPPRAKRNPQVLGSPTRTNLLTPTADPTGWSWWPTSIITITITETQTLSQTEYATTPYLIATTVTLPGITLPARQLSIIDPSRTNLITPTTPCETTRSTKSKGWWPPSVITITITETETASNVFRTTVTLPPLTLGTPPPWEKRKRNAAVETSTITRTMITSQMTSAATTLSTVTGKRGL